MRHIISGNFYCNDKKIHPYTTIPMVELVGRILMTSSQPGVAMRTVLQANGFRDLDIPDNATFARIRLDEEGQNYLVLVAKKIEGVEK